MRISYGSSALGIRKLSGSWRLGGNDLLAARGRAIHGSGQPGWKSSIHFTHWLVGGGASPRRFIKATHWRIVRC